MAEHRLGIAIEADADDSGVREMRSALDAFSKAGVQSIDKLEDRVNALRIQSVALQKQQAANRAELQALIKAVNEAGVANEQQAVRMKTLTEREGQLTQAMKQTRGALQASSQELRAMSFAQRDALGDAQQLLGVFGVAMPAALGGLETRFGAVQSAIASALPVAVITAASGAAILAVSKLYVEFDTAAGKWVDFVNTVRRYGLGDAVADATGIGGLLGRMGILTAPEADRRRRDRQTEIAGQSFPRAIQARNQAELAPLLGAARIRAELRQELGAPGVERQAAEVGALNAAANARIAVLRREAADQARQLANQTALLGLASVQAVMTAAQQEIRELEIRAARGEIVDRGAIAAIRNRASFETGELYRGIEDQVRAAQRGAQMSGLSAAGRITAGAANDVDDFFRQVSSTTAFDDRGRAAFEAYQAARIEQSQRELRELRRGHEEQITQIVEDAEVARTDARMRGLKQIDLEERRRMRDLKRLYEDGLITEQQFADARVAIEIQTQERRKEAIKDFGRTLESLYDRTIGSAKSFGDAMKRIWAEVMAQWKHQAFDALAAILLGQGSPSSAGVGPASGGGLGGILGGVLGLPGVGGAGGGVSATTPPFFPPSPFMPGTALGSTSGFGGAIGGLGGGFGNWGFPTPGGTAGQGGVGAVGPAGGILGSLAKLMNRPGLFGLTLGRTLGLGVMIAGLGRGRVSGGIFGAIGGGLSGAAIGAQLGFIGGPLGAVIGAAIGGLVGIFGGGQGQAKRDASAIADEGFARIREIVADYEAWRRDFAGSMDAINGVWAEMTNRWSGMGSVGSRSIADQRKYFEQIVTHVRSVEDERNRRRNAIANFPQPSFAVGGYTTGGGTALLHPGEFVMPSRLVERLGLSLLQGLQAGGGGSSGAGTFTLEPVSGAVLSEMLARNPQALDEGLMVVLRSGGKFSRALKA